MSDLYYIANTAYSLKCCDSKYIDVDLSKVLPSSFTVTKSKNDKVNNKEIVTNISITATALSGSVITTSTIDGSAVTFVSATTSIASGGSDISGTSEKMLVENKTACCLADSKISAATIQSYTGKGSIGTLVVTGTNSSSGVTVTDICKIWISDAGQDKVRCA